MMEVTVYVEQDKTSMISDPQAWKDKVEELSLVGQQKICKPEGNPNPFLRMDVGLVRCFETICPAKKDIQEFDAEPIPMEALSAYGLALKDGYFDKVEIWYSPRESDPVMVGSRTVSKDNTERFLMARWGPEKLSLDELMVKAKQKWIAKSISTLKETEARVKDQLGQVADLADEHFSGGWVFIH